MYKFYRTIKNKKGEEYNVIIVFDETGKLHEKSSCYCKWGSFHRWSKTNQKKKWICRHILKAYAEITKQPYAKARQTLIKQGILDKDHLIKE